MAMASKDCLKRMVMQFRVTELQSLLAFAGERIKFGKKKKDLQKKALSLISSKKVASLHNHICQLYQNLNHKDRGDNGRSTSSFPNYKEKYRDLNMHIINNLPNDRCNEWNNRSSFYDDLYGNSSSDNECDPSRLAALQNRYQKLPVRLQDIKFKTLPFFEYQTELLAVTALNPKRQDDDVFECRALFTIESDWISRIEFPYQVQMRICTLTNNIKEVSDSLPLSLNVKINDKYSTLPPPIPSTNRQGMLLRRMNVPINITPEVHRRTAVNKVLISWSVEDDELYAFTIHIVKKFTSDELIEKLKNKGESDPAITKKTIFNNLNDEDDDEIGAMSLKISLVCPLGKILISLPTRASSCNHLQCFDGSLYIKMNDVKSTWTCPICNLPCLYENLFIDGYFSSILKSDRFPNDVTEVEFDADANWTPVFPKKRNISDSSPSLPNKKLIITPVTSPCHNSQEIPEVPAPLPVPSPKPQVPAPLSVPSPEPPPVRAKNTEIDLVSDGESSNDLANDLQDFYYQYNKDAELCSYRSAFPILPSFKEVRNHFLNVKEVEQVRAPVPTIVSPNKKENNNAPKKQILEVDLTETDSESDGIPLSDDSDNNGYRSNSSTTIAASGPSEPPCYDIDDSDSDF